MATNDNAQEMSKQVRSISIALVLIVLVAIGIAVVGLLMLKPSQEYIQGQAEGTLIRVSGKMPGRVEKLYVQEGQRVSKGDTLARIYSSVVDAKLLQAKSMEAAAQAQSNKAEAGTRHQIVSAAHELLQQAIAAQTVTRKTYERVQNLYNQGVISAQKRDEAEAAYNAATAQVGAAQAQYDLAREGAQKEDKNAARAVQQAASGSVKEVESILEDEYLLAPCDGEINDTYPEEGELVMSGSPVVSILKTNDEWVTFNVREEMLSGLGMGKEVTVKIPGLEMKEVPMTIYYIRDKGSYAVWTATKATGSYDSKTFEVRMRPAQPVEGLRPGMSVLMK